MVSTEPSGLLQVTVFRIVVSKATQASVVVVVTQLPVHPVKLSAVSLSEGREPVQFASIDGVMSERWHETVLVRVAPVPQATDHDSHSPVCQLYVRAGVGVGVGVGVAAGAGVGLTTGAGVAVPTGVGAGVGSCRMVGGATVRRITTTSVELWAWAGAHRAPTLHAARTRIFFISRVFRMGKKKSIHPFE